MTILPEPQLICQDGTFDAKKKHRFSIIILCDDEYYELKQAYISDPAFALTWAEKISFFRKQSARHSIKRTSEWWAERILGKSRTYCRECRYITTVSRPGRVYERHVVIVKVDRCDLDGTKDLVATKDSRQLIPKKHLRLLEVPAGSRHEQARSAVLGMTVVMVPPPNVSLVQRLVSSSS